MAITKVKTQYGDVEGVSCADGAYSVFKGIPYAKPPVGELRYLAPQKPDAWEGVRLCSEFSPAPMQVRMGGRDLDMSEDCLYLNVFTPAQTGEEKLPVMFWIYGGVFSFGYAHEATYDGAALCAKDCILVTINYRVNVFGFFNTPEIEARNGGPRCCGILDQIAALQWVKDNIAAFGGDPDRVMIFGQSAGGVSTRMLLCSPLTKGMFSRAVAHSGGGLNEADVCRSAADFTDMCVRTLEHVGWTMEDMMTRPAQEIFDTMMPAVSETMADGDLKYFQPFIDGYALTDVAGVNIYNGNYHDDVAVMCGTVAGDSWMFTRKVREELAGNNNYFKAFALSPSVAWGRHNVKTGCDPIYSYYMDRKQPPRKIGYYSHGEPPFGADTPHACELAYIFGTLRDERFTDYDYALAETLRAYWTNFAKTGDPNGEGLPQWPLFTAETPLTMHFGETDVKAENLVENEEMERVMRFSENTPGMLESLEGF